MLRGLEGGLVYPYLGDNFPFGFRNFDSTCLLAAAPAHIFFTSRSIPTANAEGLRRSEGT